MDDYSGNKHALFYFKTQNFNEDQDLLNIGWVTERNLRCKIDQIW